MKALFTGPLLVQRPGGRRPGRLAAAAQGCSTSEDFHSHIHSHPPIHAAQKQKPSIHKTWLRFLVLFLSSVLVGDGQELEDAP